MRAGRVCEHPTSEPLTSAAASSWWPTPLGRDYKPAGSTDLRGGTGRPLSEAVLWWPTPDASLLNYGQTPEAWEARRARLLALGLNSNGAGETLAYAARMWATPTVGDSRGAGSRNTPGSTANPGISLSDQIRTGASSGRSRPPATMPRPGPPSSRSGPTSLRLFDDPVEAEGPEPVTSVDLEHRLNPRFVEWLMGLEPGTLPEELSHRQRLALLGNGVVPQQAAVALAALIEGIGS